MTQKYGILAYPAKHSLSPVLHNAAFRTLGIDARYEIFEVAPDGFDDFIQKVKNEPIDGLSVSLPYKEVIMNYLDGIDPDAKKIGAVNTVVNKNGNLYGFNTDYIGAIKVFKEQEPSLKGKIAVIMGGGGGARSIAYGLLKEGAHVWIKNRTKSKADRIALEFAEWFDAEIHSDDWDNWQTGDILINATSFWINNPGVTANELPYFCSPGFIQDFKIVMDISYNVQMDNYPDPLITPLLEQAEVMGKTIVTGDKMLLYQAVEQFKLWTMKEAPIDAMKKALYSAL